MAIKGLIDRIIEDGKITSAERDELEAAIIEDGKLDAEEVEQISRVFDMIKNGQLRHVITRRGDAGR